MKQFGLIGYPLSHSFSKRYFNEKFKNENIINHSYEMFEMKNVDQLKEIINQHPKLRGINVTIPHKQSIIKILSEIDPIAKEIGAVNTVKIDFESKKLIGFNTDYYGFKKSLKPFLEIKQERALILGTGGASKAVYYALKELNIDCLFVSRNPTNDNEIGYSDVNEYVLKHHQIIVNTTPLGMSPNIDCCPDINYSLLTSGHLLYDLIYNPEETLFLKNGKVQGCITINGMEMLKLQAEKSWEIWND